MKYLINKSVCFDSSSGLLSLKKDEESSVQLSRPGLRLLLELVTHRGITLTREILLRRVWEEHGLIPSNNNLSNHISFLRKTFFQMGLTENIIITVPREGFRLETNVQPLTCSTNQSNSDPSEITDDNIFKKEKKTSLENKLIVKIIVIAATIVLMTFIFILVVKKNVNYHNNISHHEIEFCLLQDIASDKNEWLKDKISTIRKIITEKNIDCKTQQKIIYFNIPDCYSEEKCNLREVLLYQCLLDNNGNETHCKNYFLINIKSP